MPVHDTHDTCRDTSHDTHNTCHDTGHDTGRDTHDTDHGTCHDTLLLLKVLIHSFYDIVCELLSYRR